MLACLYFVAKNECFSKYSNVFAYVFKYFVTFPHKK
jgi:hypothetical protein